MRRRTFLAASGLAATGSLNQLTGAADHPSSGKQYLEVRHYALASAEKQAAFDKFLTEAAIPALNRLGVAPVARWPRLLSPSLSVERVSWV